MKRQQAFRFRIEPNGAQKRAMSQFAGNARKVWNLALARQQEIYTESKQFTNSFGMNHWLLAAVGAINILERGRRSLACGEKTQSGRSRKQEPTQASYARVA